MSGSGGVCFGFRIRSEVAFQFLRRGPADDLLEIRETEGDPLSAPDEDLVAEWVLRETGVDVTARLYHREGVFHSWTNDGGWFRVAPAARLIEMTRASNLLRREQRLWGIPLVTCLIERGDLALHAAAVDVGGSAVILAAPGRHGKTTLALAFHQRGYRILSEDTTCCRPGTPPEVLPGPTSVRLRPDLFQGTAPGGTRVLAVSPDRIHLVLEPDRAGSSGPVPITALVFLRGPADDIQLQAVKGADALRDLWALSFRLRTPEARSRSFAGLAELAGRIAIWNLRRPMTVAALDRVVAAIVAAC